MKHKVSELTGGLLDAAVAMARGNQVKIENGRAYILVPYDDGSQVNSGRTEWLSFSPSRLWDEGGWIIENEHIAIAPYEHGIGEPSMWVAWVEERQHQATFDSYFERGIFDDNSRGHTPLIAAMRAFVASKLGEEVELP
jgi:hypothetical protein